MNFHKRYGFTCLLTGAGRGGGEEVQKVSAPTVNIHDFECKEITTKIHDFSWKQICMVGHVTARST